MQRLKQVLAVVGITGVTLLLGVAPGWAQPKRSLPCHADVEKFCKKPGVKQSVRECLQEHLSELSPECRARVESGGGGGGAARRGGGQRLQKACQAELDKYCKDVKPGRGSYRRCLKEHEGELSEECKAQIERMQRKPDRAAGRTRNACQAELQKYCKDMKPGQGAGIECLKAHEEELSDQCKAQLKVAMERRAKRESERGTRKAPDPAAQAPTSDKE